MPSALHIRAKTARDGRVEAPALQRGLELDLHEQAPQVAAARRASARRSREHRLEREIGSLAVGEVARSRAARRASPSEKRRMAVARGVDLLRRDAAVGLGDVAHDLEGRAEEARALTALRRSPSPRQTGAPLRAAVELVPDQQAHDRAEQPATDDRAEHRADESCRTSPWIP